MRPKTAKTKGIVSPNETKRFRDEGRKSLKSLGCEIRGFRRIVCFQWVDRHFASRSRRLHHRRRGRQAAAVSEGLDIRVSALTAIPAIIAHSSTKGKLFYYFLSSYIRREILDLRATASGPAF
jgi:hypothetical protein